MPANPVEEQDSGDVGRRSLVTRASECLSLIHSKSLWTVRMHLEGCRAHQDREEDAQMSKSTWALGQEDRNQDVWGFPLSLG